MAVVDGVAGPVAEADELVAGQDLVVVRGRAIDGTE